MLIKILDYLIDIIDKCYHQKRLVKTLKKINKNYHLIIDIGFSYGNYSNLFIKKLSPKRIIGFEASGKTYDQVKNKFRNSKIRLYNIGVSSSTGKKKLNVYKKNSINSFQNIKKNSLYSNFKKKIFNIQHGDYEITNISTLDRLCQNHKKISMLKIDVEGHELEVLKGGKKTLKKTKIILIEIHQTNQYVNYSKNKIYKFLKKENFQLIKKFRFPFMKWEDRIYINKKY
jgi:FkbM family methyltransferase